MESIHEMTPEELGEAYEVGYNLLKKLLIGEAEITMLCNGIDSVMGDNIAMFVRATNPLYQLFPGAVKIPDLNEETKLLLHHTAHFYMTVAIGLAVKYDLLYQPPEAGKKNGKVT